MEPNVIEKELLKKWKKNEWKSLSPGKLEIIRACREMRIGKLEWCAMHAGIHCIYPSDDDDLNYKERPSV
jgi:hypothetical protein